MIAFDAGAHRVAASSHVSGAPAAVRTPTGHVPALDGVRGTAVLAVMIYHFATSLDILRIPVPFLSILQFGWSGVDVFFVLSGFLITGGLLNAKHAAHFFRDFYTRRGLRIFPLYFAALAVVAVLVRVLPDAGVWGDRSALWSPGSLLWPATFLENVALALGGPGGSGLLTHFWSLAVEEHFYLVWPLLVWASRSQRQILTWTALAIAVSLAGRVIAWRTGANLSSVAGLTPLRLDGLAIGAATAVLVRAIDIHQLVRPAMAVMVGCIALLVALLGLRHTAQQTDPAIWLFSFPLTSLLTAAAIVVCLGGGLLGDVLALPPLRWLGRYSYGLYVWHPILNVLLLHSRLSPVSQGASTTDVLAVCALAFSLDLALAYASYHCWEEGFLHLKRRFEPGGTYRTQAAISLPAQPSAERSL